MNGLLGCMEHSDWLQGNCRVCGGRVGRFKVSYHTAQHQEKLQAIGVSVKNDKKNIHPQTFCHSCYNVCTRAIKASKNGKDYTTKLENFQWVEHTDSNCSVCTHFGEVKKGRKPKKTSTGRPPDQVLDLVEDIKKRSPPSLLLDFQQREKLSKLQELEDLNCPLCHLVVDRPLLLTTCNTLVCLTCCVNYIYQHTDLSCPFCGVAHILDNSTVIPAPPVILKLLEEKCRPVPTGKYT